LLRQLFEVVLNEITLVLSSEEIAAIDAAGALGEKKANARAMVKKVAVGAIACVAFFGACSLFGIHMV